MKRYLTPVLVFVVLAALLIVGLGIAGRAVDREAAVGPVVPAGSPSAAPTDPTEPALDPFYSQSLSWDSCDGGFECAELEVPVDYADPDGETIELALLKVPASGDDSERVGSLVVNPGGPGAPGTQYAAAAERVFREPLLEAFDIVGFDPRGTGGSAPVDCLTDSDLDDYLAMDPSPDTAAEESTYLEWNDRFGAGCVDRTGDLIEHVTTVEAARDMDVLRAALGEERLAYFGASYGTKLGATYAELFPDRVGRLVLDGAVDVAMSSRDASLGQAGGFQTALEAYVQDCVDNSSSCYLGDSLEAGLERIKDFLADTDQEPLPTGEDRDLTEGRALFGIITPLYNRDYWFLLDQALKNGLGGDGAGLLQLADAYSSRQGGSYLDNSVEALYAINCLDDPWSIGVDEVEDEVSDFEEASPTLGRTFAWMLTGCSGIQAEATVETPRIDAEGAAPIVVVGTTRDPATPYAWAEALADELDSGVLVSRDGDGHTAYNSGNSCVDEALEAYLVEGTVPEDGLSC